MSLSFPLKSETMIDEEQKADKTQPEEALPLEEENVSHAIKAEIPAEEETQPEAENAAVLETSLEEAPVESEMPLEAEVDVKIETPPETEAPPQEEAAAEKETPAEEESAAEKETLNEEEVPIEKEPSPEGEVAHVDFDLLDTEGRWLLKVVSGPNTGAEFAMHSDSSYLLGTDTKECDIVFQDLSISRKHARLSVDVRDHAVLEDLNSRNGTFIGGEKVSTKEISGNVLVSMGTTSFMLYDREAEHTTIIAPATQEKKEDSKEVKKAEDYLGPIQEAVLPPLQSEVERVKEEERLRTSSSRAIGSLVVLAIITSVILLLGVGTIFLFRTEAILTPSVSEPDREISRVLAAFPAVKYSYNPTNNRLMLVGHVLITTDRSRLIDSLQQLKFIRDIDYSSVVIDELVWRETNLLLGKNPAWRGISLTSPTAGKYVITGFLRTRNQASELFDYLSLNFPYTDLLERKVVIEEDLLAQVRRELVGAGFRGVTPALANGELTLTGLIELGAKERLQKLVTLFRSLPGIRTVNSLVNEVGEKEAVINLTEKYRVSGYAKSGRKSSVVLNGRILAQGDILDGMLITDITTTTIYLEKDGVKYKIDFNR